MVVNLIFDNRDQEEDFMIRQKKSKREEKSSRSTMNKKTELIFGVVSIISGIIALIILLFVFFVHPSEKAVGERFILDEFTFYTPVYQFHFKPITLFVVFSFSFLVFGAESLYSQLSKISLFTKRLIFIFLFLTTFIFAYETLQNFLMWTSFYVLTSGEIPLDVLTHQVNPAMLGPVNFLFISKVFSLFLFSSLYGLYFFHRTMKTDTVSQKIQRKK